MARIKIYDPTTSSWVYADMAIQRVLPDGSADGDIPIWDDTNDEWDVGQPPVKDVQDSSGSSVVSNGVATLSPTVIAQDTAPTDTSVIWVDTDDTSGGTLPDGTNNGDALIWNGSAWTAQAKGTITSGSTGYATGGDVYTVVGNVESALSAINTALEDLIGGES